MDLLTAGGLLAERAPIPDFLVTTGMRRLIATRDAGMLARMPAATRISRAP